MMSPNHGSRYCPLQRASSAALAGRCVEVSGADEDGDRCFACCSSASAYQRTSRLSPGAVKCFISASPSTVRASSASPLIMNTKPLLRSGSRASIEYMPFSVPVCHTLH